MRLLRNMFVVIIVSIILQAIWEYVACDLFYTMDDLTGHTRLMMSATFGDVMMTLALFIILALVNKDDNWVIKKWEFKETVITVLYGLFLSFYFEVSALYNGRWGYNESMPLFPNTNIALLPVLQLVILFPLTFFITKWIIKRFFIE